MANRTRAEMEKHIAAGGGVPWEDAEGGFRMITTVADLPDHAAVAGDDEAKRAAARADLVARRQALDAEIAKLEPPAPALKLAESPAKTVTSHHAPQGDKK